MKKKNAEQVLQRVPPVEASPEYGLTLAQVAERTAAGCANLPVEPPTRTVGQIVLSNVFTYFNMLFVLLAVCIILVRSWLDLTFMGVVFFNTAIGIIQELRSKHTLDKLQILVSPKAGVIREGNRLTVPTSELVRDDVAIFAKGDQICADARVLAGEVQVNESLITGEQDEVSKGPGDVLNSGSFVVAGECRARLTAVGAESFASRLTLEAKKHGKGRQSEMMRSLSRLVKVIGFVVIPLGLVIFWKEWSWLGRDLHAAVTGTVAAVIGMIPEGLYLLTSLALMAGILRLLKKKTLCHTMASIETLARVDILCVDKTGTITENKMTVEDLVLLREEEFGDEFIRQILADYVHALPGENETMEALQRRFGGSLSRKAENTLPFTSAKKYGGISFGPGDCWLLGAPEFLMRQDYGDLREEVERWSDLGCRVLLLAAYNGSLEDELTGTLRPAALVLLSNKIRREAPDTFRYFAEQGVTVKVISGDNPRTVSEVARRAGIPHAEEFVDASTLANDAALQAAALRYTVFGRVTPEQKRKLVLAMKGAGHTVAMTGDGVNDVLALKVADCGIAMASGSSVACQAANVVLMNSDFSSMPSVVQEGRRVINNIQRSASLYLVKNIFSFCLSIITLCFTLPYPFSPAGLSLVNIVAIGIPSFVLAMEPNHSLVTGRFLPNVLYKALPAALADLTLILGILAFYEVMGLAPESLKSVATGVMGVVGLMMVDRVSRPYTKLRIALISVMSAFFAVAYLFFKQYFTLPPMGKEAWLVFVVFALLARPVMSFFARWLDRVTEFIRSRRKEMDL